MANHGSEHSKDEQPSERLKAVEALKKLSPEERIRRLKELEEERKKEIEEAEELIKETTRELADAEEKRRIPIPEARATDLSTLNTLEEKELVATHHNLSTAPAATNLTSSQSLPLQQKTLEEVATEEAPATQQQTQQQQMQSFQKPAYAIGTEQQRSAFGEYLSKSQQTVTGGGTSPDTGQLEKITEVYKDRSVTGAETGDPQQKYFGKHESVTGGYEMRKREEEDKKTQSDFYKRRSGGPA